MRDFRNGKDDDEGLAGEDGGRAQRTGVDIETVEAGAGHARWMANSGSSRRDDAERGENPRDERAAHQFIRVVSEPWTILIK
jgi:hypothetical protein